MAHRGIFTAQQLLEAMQQRRDRSSTRRAEHDRIRATRLPPLHRHSRDDRKDEIDSSSESESESENGLISPDAPEFIKSALVIDHKNRQHRPQVAFQVRKLVHLGFSGLTLVQGRDGEVQRHSSDGTVSICIYHGLDAYHRIRARHCCHLLLDHGLVQWSRSATFTQCTEMRTAWKGS